MDYKKKIKEIQNEAWEGMCFNTYRRELIRVYKMLDFFENRALNDYLNRNERTVVDSIDEDKPPKEVAEKLLEEEKNNKNREKVIKELKKFLI